MENQFKQDQIHDLRKQVDQVIKNTNVLRTNSGRPKGMREVKLAYTKLQEAKMWLGKVLEEMGSELPVEYRDEAQPIANPNISEGIHVGDTKIL